jgi:hypothetical protein
MLLLFISAKHFNDFLERFFFKAITPTILVLIIIYLLKFKECKFKKFNGFSYLVLFYALTDLLLRLYYTFILDMDNQTRYFNVQAILYLIPAALAWEFLYESSKIKKQRFLIITCMIIFLFGAIRSIRPKWDNPEYEIFAQIIQDDPVELKYAYRLREDDHGIISFRRAVRLSYYAGVYRTRDLDIERIATEGNCYVISHKAYKKALFYQLNLIKSVTDNSGKSFFLYKAIKTVSLPD